VTPRPPGGGRVRSGRYRPAHRAPRPGLTSRGRVRAFGLFLVVTVTFVVICAKLVVIQGFDSASYLAQGGSEWQESVSLPGERGAILDRNGYELAMSVPQTTIYADPHEVNAPAAEAAALAPVLGVDANTLQHQLSEKTTFVYLARTVPDDTAKRVAALNLAGIYSLSEPKRFYPAGQLASPLLGTVGIDGTGLSGLEYKYNSVLSGHAGKEVEQIDPRGRLIPGGIEDYQAPVTGDDLVLSIDEPLQYQAEQALAQDLVAASAKRGIALLMDTQTGEILADAEINMPTPGSTKPPAVPVTIPAPPGSSGPQPQPVQAPSATSFTDVYEPGSVNKLITISAALQEGVIKPSDTYRIPNSYPVAGTVFHDAEPHPTEHWTVTDILANSSNIGTIQIAQKLGRTSLMRFIQDYGLGAVSNIDFPGESPGILPSYWSGTSIADVPIGQGIAVTAVQMLAAYNTIADGGVYVAPRLVDGTIDAQGHEHVLPMAPSYRVVSPTVAQEMTTMLDEVVRVGTGTAANLDPYTVAGKTGTGLVPSPTGGYEAGHYVASFAGFVPSEKPRITGMVVVDDTPDYGAAASAPVFASIARDALEELSIPPQPKQPPAPGVPLATTQSATGAGEVAGTPLPGMNAPTTAGTASPASGTPAPAWGTAAPGSGTAGPGSGTAGPGSGTAAPAGGSGSSNPPGSTTTAPPNPEGSTANTASTAAPAGRPTPAPAGPATGTTTPVTRPSTTTTTAGPSRSSPTTR
jgi:cell division protein FtsI (penicillin-binding protein 3)